jgi:hypothetical protein
MNHSAFRSRQLVIEVQSITKHRAIEPEGGTADQVINRAIEPEGGTTEQVINRATEPE